MESNRAVCFFTGALFLTVVVVGALLHAYFTRYDTVVTVHHFSWHRAIDIESFQTVHRNRTTWRPPSDAFNVSSWSESSVRVSTDANGHATVHTDSTTYWRYDVDRWVHLFRLESKNKSHTPSWPQHTLKMGPRGRLNRIANRYETYQVCFLDNDTETIHEVDYADWISYKESETVTITRDGFGRLKNVTRLEE